MPASLAHESLNYRYSEFIQAQTRAHGHVKDKRQEEQTG